MTPPPECLPLTPFRWIRPTDLVFQILLRCLPWRNWTPASVAIIQSELIIFPKIQFAFAKTGFWIKYPVQNPNFQLMVEIYVRTVA